MEWGGKDYTDIMNGVDAVLAKNPWIDADRLGVTGGSYGGYMTNWIVGHTTRFKAAVTLRSISNFISDDGTRDGAYGHADDFGGDIFENLDLYWDRSPLKYAKNVKTPTLILHSDNDYSRARSSRASSGSGRSSISAMPSEIVFFPRENHNLTRTGEPKHLVESLELAGLLVRPVPERQRCGRSAGRAGTAKRERHTGALTGLLTFVIEELSCRTVWKSQPLRVAGVLGSIADVDATRRIEMVTMNQQHAKSR